MSQDCLLFLPTHLAESAIWSAPDDWGVILAWNGGSFAVAIAVLVSWNRGTSIHTCKSTIGMCIFTAYRSSRQERVRVWTERMA